MATLEDLASRYMSDSAFRSKLRADIDKTFPDGKINPMKLVSLAKSYGVNISPADIPHVISKAKELGFIK